jgi:polyisoprenoid-binding protein YceI
VRTAIVSTNDRWKNQTSTTADQNLTATLQHASESVPHVARLYELPGEPRPLVLKGLLMTKRFLLFGGPLALAVPLALAQTSTWVPDKAHSEVDFSVLHMSLSNIHGRFGNISGTIALNESDITKSSVSVNIDVNTIDTGVGPRDADLKGANFFDVAQFPTATFASTSIAKSGDGLSVTGNLTLHGVTKSVVIRVTGPTGPVPGMDKKPHSGFSGTTIIRRTDFSIATKFPTAVIGDEVNLTVDLDAAKQSSESR